MNVRLQPKIARFLGGGGVSTIGCIISNMLHTVCGSKYSVHKVFALIYTFAPTIGWFSLWQYELVPLPDHLPTLLLSYSHFYLLFLNSPTPFSPSLIHPTPPLPLWDVIFRISKHPNTFRSIFITYPIIIKHIHTMKKEHQERKTQYPRQKKKKHTI